MAVYVINIVYITLKPRHVSALKGHYRVGTVVYRTVYVYKVQNYTCHAEVRDGLNNMVYIRWPTYRFKLATQLMFNPYPANVEKMASS